MDEKKKLKCTLRAVLGVSLASVPGHALNAEEPVAGVLSPAAAGLDATFDLAAADANEEKPFAPGAASYPRQHEGFLPLAEFARRDREKIERRIERREIAYQLLNVIDGVQTISCLEAGKCEEMNPLLGKRPSAGEVVAFKIAGGGLHYLGTRFLEDKFPEAVAPFQIISVVAMGGAVAWNMQFVF